VTDVPVWLLDIDGVLNAISSKPDRTVWPADAWREFDATDERTNTTWPILAAEPVAAFIRDVHTSGRAEVRWHTTWQESANKVGAELGLPELEVQDAPEFRDEAEHYLGWWKLAAALRVIQDEQRPLIWTDDDATMGRIMPTPYDQVRAFPNLLIAPQQRIGLTRKQLRAIDEHLTLLEASA
jgi:hypothetical protein